ncbi:hypothetical protein B0T19DRAFT_381442 [Cercophora scortea]|uniref:Uncharacterized protein n=1 Tax=Cercophora scortea TaxID=314031 RepID=A0AAE0IWZ5_9PEZI|nr:hypothetical protein B0T19DRAFT_381442 [Cercophora scortea]
MLTHKLENIANLSVSPKVELARPAMLSRRGRDTVANHSTCASDEVKCSQGAWCCKGDETCSLENGVFLCCSSWLSTGKSCARVCAAGTFECGFICCADGQSCIAGSTVLPYCTGDAKAVISTRTSTSTATLSQLSSLDTSHASSSVARTMGNSSLHVATTSIDPSRSTASQNSPSESRAGGNTGLPVSAQIALGVAVPIVVILIIVGMWLCLFRRQRQAAVVTVAEALGEEDNASMYDLPTPPPAYSKNEIVVVTTEGCALSAELASSTDTDEAHEMGAVVGDGRREVGNSRSSD